MLLGNGKIPNDDFKLPNIQSPHSDLIYVICFDSQYPIKKHKQWISIFINARLKE